MDYALCSEYFALGFTKLPHLDSEENQRKCLTALIEENKKNIAITRGHKGLIYLENGKINTRPAYNVKSVDTTAAGDIFHGAFAYSMLKNMSFYEALQFSSIAAALSTTDYGGRSSIPGLNKVQKFYEKSQK